MGGFIRGSNFFHFVKWMLQGKQVDYHELAIINNFMVIGGIVGGKGIIDKGDSGWVTNQLMDMELDYGSN